MMVNPYNLKTDFLGLLALQDRLVDPQNPTPEEIEKIRAELNQKGDGQ